jgi:hypothetical protein
MTLARTELVYQADFMNVSPSADGAVFSGIGNRIITGLVPTLLNGSVQVTAGKALVQGRLFELTSTKTYTPSTTMGTQYLGLMVDLTQLNVDGDTVTNNQYTVGFFNSPSGNLVIGDSKANIPLFKMTGTTSVIVAPEMNGSIVRTWQPNTQYSIGDLVTFNSLGTDTTGKLTNPIFKAVQTHVSDTTFPSSSNTQWVLINISAYYIELNYNSYAVNFYFKRFGKLVNVSTSSVSHTLSDAYFISKEKGKTVLPDVFKPINNVFLSTGASIIQLDIGGNIIARGSGNTVGSLMAGIYIPMGDPVWNAGVPS